MKASTLRIIQGAGVRNLFANGGGGGVGRAWPIYGHAPSHDKIMVCGFADAAANTVNLPGTEGVDWKPGDLAISCGYNSSGTTAVSTPAGWTAIVGSGGNTNRIDTFYRVLVTGDTSTGTLTNATHCMVFIVRGHDPLAFLGRFGTTGALSSTISGTTFTGAEPADGRSLQLFVGGHRSASNMNQNVSGWTNAGPAQAKLACLYMLRTNDAPAISYTVSASSGWRTVNIQIRPATIRRERIR